MSARTAGVYERVSKAKDKRASKLDRSIEEQNGANRQACADEGWTIARTFQDPNRSASRFTSRAREAYGELLTAIGREEFSVLVLWESSRGGRELEAWAHLLNACREHKVKIYVTSHERLYDVARGRDWKALADDGTDSAYESEKTSLRALRARPPDAVNGPPHAL